MTDRIERAEVLVASPGRNFVTLKITTADGIVGWGDATVNGRELAAASYLGDHVVPLLIGRDPGRIEDTWQYLYRGAYWRRGPITMAAIAAVDVALWDILGKRAGLPLYQLLGGRSRDGVLCYTHAFGFELPALLEAVDQRREQGFRAIRAQSGVPGLDTVYGVSKDPAYEPAGRGLPKTETWHTPAYLAHVPQLLIAVRDHVGPELALLHDVHHRLTPTEAARFARAVEPADLFWLEDVTPAEDQAALRRVRAASTTPLAIGEVFNSVWDCQQLITERLIDYLRASVVHTGGISHLRKIWAFAEPYGVRGGPHGPSDVSPISFAASLHLSLAAHNTGIHENMGYPVETAEVFDHGWSFTDGYLDLDDRPGLGVDYDEVAAAGFPYQQAFLPTARSRDGAVTDW